MTNEGKLYQVSPADLGLDDEAAATFNALLASWQRHLPGNLRNQRYYDGEVRSMDGEKDADVLRDVRIVSGWAGKAVDMLAGRSVLVGFAGADADALAEATGGVDLAELYRMALVSELVCSCSFLTVSRGLPGEPGAIVSAYSAADATALWDWRRKRIKAGLVVVDCDDAPDGTVQPTWVNMYTDSTLYSCRRASAAGAWEAQSAPNPFGRPPMAVMRYRPSLTRPFGRPRVSRTVRSLVDRALRAAARMENSATFYTWPQRYFNGLDKKTAAELGKSPLQIYESVLLLLSPNSNGDKVDVGQLPQMSMQPHIEHLQAIAKEFAGETSIPLNSLGIVQDNPSSADAMYAAANDLIVEAEWLNSSNGAALADVAAMALATARGTGLAAVDAKPRFANPIRPSMAARADFGVKVAGVAPAYGSTEYFWRDLGYDETDVRGIMDAVERTKSREQLAAILAGGSGGSGGAQADAQGGGEA